MIVIRLQGGLGNQMFQYAFARSVSNQLNTNFALDCRFLLDRTPKPKYTFRDYDLSIFSINPTFYKTNQNLTSSQVYTDKLLNNGIKKLQQFLPSFNIGLYVEPHFHFDKNYLNKANEAYCVGYYQSFKYFEAITDIILQDFSFKESIDNNCIDLLNSIKNCNSICVHIRRGDFVNHTYHGTTNIDYYTKALHILKEKEKDLELFLFSDDINWCKENVNLGMPINFVAEAFAGLKAKNHFQLMRSCKHFIISNSSFAWWAAYLANNTNKQIFVPQQWVQDNGVITKDLFPSSWTII